MSRTYVAVDLETTGLDAERDAVIEIAAVKFRADAEIESWSTLVNPHRHLPYKIQLLTGLRPQDLEDAPSVAQVVGQLSSFAHNHTIVGHNVGFDLAFLRPHGVLLRNPSLDTLPLASIMVPEATGYSLQDLCRLLSIKVENAHRALDDARATSQLFAELLRRALQMDLSVVQEINRLARSSGWPLRTFFEELERERALTAFTGGVREQLRAKGDPDAAALGLVLGQRQAPEPIQPSPERQTLDEEELAELFAPGGLLASRFAGYEHRPQQIEMMRAVTRAFNYGGQLLAEAGTGTGKSLAYLLPAIQFATRNGRPVVVSTNTINLQDQLFNKDIPDLQGLIPVEFRAALLKGRSNYLCLRRLGLFRRSQSLEPEAVQVLAKVLAWLPATDSGDVAELSLRDQEMQIWRELQAEQDSCLGDRCPHLRKGRCFLYRARHRAESAHIIVVNHALLVSDMLVSNRVLPEYHHLIIDEAHHLEGRATDQLTFSVNRFQARGILFSLYTHSDTGLPGGFLPAIPQHFRGSKVSAEVQSRVGDLLVQLERHVTDSMASVDRLFDTLQAFVEEVVPAARRERLSYDLHLSLTSGMRVQPSWSQMEIEADDLDQDLGKLETGLLSLHSGFEELEDQGIAAYDDLVQDIWSRLSQVRRLREQTYAVINDPQGTQVYWLSIGTRNSEVSLNAAPLHVGPLLEASLFPELETLILTSATLSTARSFHYIRDRLSLQDADELRVDSPFDYAESTLLYLPVDIPEPAEPSYDSTLSRAMVDLCLATRGRALLLFTSHRQLRSTYYAMARPLEEAGIAVFGQGLDGSRRQLLNRFRETPRCVLLGTRSFWEGIDVVGPALSCLVITRLPFAVPSDPVFSARSSSFEDPFGQYAVPDAVLRFRQGFGRLIRSYTDRGVVVVLDKRVITKAYGQAFLKSLPDCTTYRGSLSELPGMAEHWIEGTPQPRLRDRRSRQQR